MTKNNAVVTSHQFRSKRGGAVAKARRYGTAVKESLILGVSAVLLIATGPFALGQNLTSNAVVPGNGAVI